MKLVKMNIDEHPAIAGQLGIQSIPAVIAFENGQPVDGFMGALPESQIRDFIEKLAGRAAASRRSPRRLPPRKQAREAGDLQTAAEIFDAVLQRAARQSRGDRRARRPACSRRRHAGRGRGACRARRKTSRTLPPSRP